MSNEPANKIEDQFLSRTNSSAEKSKMINRIWVFKSALNTNTTVMVFPIKGKLQGYVVMLVKAEGMPKVKIMPDAEFVVTQAYMMKSRLKLLFQKKLISLL